LIGSKSKNTGQRSGKQGSSGLAVPDRSSVHRSTGKRPAVARILLADSDLASRLTLSTLLAAGGYSVDSAASASEAIDRMDKHEYQLVLADLRLESEDAGQRVLAYARQKCYRPATALVTSFLHTGHGVADSDLEHRIAVDNDDVSKMLDRVAELIGMRVSRRVNRRLAKVS
jgi:CheY-like chemotaxis protein